LINHYTNAKDIWDNVKMLLEGSELTKEDRESQLYDDFEHFHTPQHYQSQSSTIPPTTYHQPHSTDTSQSDLGLSPTDYLIENLTNTLALLTQLYKTFLPQTNNQLRTLSNPRNQAIVQDGRVVVQNVQGRQNRGQGNNARGAGAAGYGRAHNRVGNANPGHARQNSEYFKDKMLLMQAQENGVVLDEEQLLFLAGGQDNAIDEDVDEQPVQDLALNVDNVFQADDYKVEDKLSNKQASPIQNSSQKCKPRSYYDEVNNRYRHKNPLCLHRARQVQPALYSGHVIVTPNHAPAVVRDCEETLEQSEISRKKMHDKMKANECVDNKMKAEALKEQNTRPIKALTVYPLNTPATLVPRVLSTKSQILELLSKASSYVLIRMVLNYIKVLGSILYTISVEAHDESPPNLLAIQRAPRTNHGLRGSSFLRSKDETPTVVRSFLSKKYKSVSSNVKFIRTVKGTEFVTRLCMIIMKALESFTKDSAKDLSTPNGVVRKDGTDACRVQQALTRPNLFKGTDVSFGLEAALLPSYNPKPFP
ncbi:hypothetical protein Tco_0994456, partial [Tanacetum coccineum]